LTLRLLDPALAALSASMRERHPIGTKLKVRAKIKDTVLDPHLYTSWQWPYEVVSDQEATEFIRQHYSRDPL
jgi:hypothetical protein